MIKDVISFKDFLRNQSVSLPNPIKMDREDFTDEEFDFESEEEQIFEENKELTNGKDSYQYDEEDNHLQFDFNTDKKEDVQSESKDYYKLYQDVNENFVCDIHIDGVNIEKVTPRLVIESDGLNVMYNGTIENGKCKIPVNKLNFFEEGKIGKIKLEIIADNSIFTPWEDEYIIYKKVKTIF